MEGGKQDSQRNWTTDLKKVYRQAKSITQPPGNPHAIPKPVNIRIETDTIGPVEVSGHCPKFMAVEKMNKLAKENKFPVGDESAVDTSDVHDLMGLFRLGRVPQVVCDLEVCVGIGLKHQHYISSHT